MFQAAKLPGSHLGLDCDQILASPFPVRHGVVENTVGLGTGPPGGIRACMLTALELIRECLSSDWLLGFALLITCALVIVICPFMGTRIHSTTTGEKLLPAGGASTSPKKKCGAVVSKLDYLEVINGPAIAGRRNTRSGGVA